MPRSKGGKTREEEISPSPGKQPEQPKKPRKKVAGPRGQSQSCHQCRQSIHSSKGVSEVKTGKERLKCSTCTRFWCEQCLLNRYGLVKADADPDSWSCPVCRGKCNCSLCRKKAGKLATGILTPLVKSSGFDSVSEFLDKGTDDIAKVLQWQNSEITTGRATGKKRPSPGKSKSEAPAKTKRRKISKDTENSHSLANGGKPTTPPPLPPLTPPPSAPVISADNEHHDIASGGCGARNKRRKLSHPTHFITVEHDLLLATPTAATAKGSPSTRGQSSTPNMASKTLQKSPLGRGQRSSKIVKTPPTIGVRRSSRRRSSTQLYTASSPRRDKRSVSFKSPTPSDAYLSTPPPLPDPNPFNPPSSPSLTKSPTSPAQITDLKTNKKLELHTLIESRVSLFRLQKLDLRLKDREERAQKRAEIRSAREKEREKALEERERKRTENKAAKEKALLAKSVLKEARRDQKQRYRERERMKKQAELRDLKEKKTSEKLQRKELATAPLLDSPTEVQIFSEDQESVFDQALPLPVLPPLNLPVSTEMFPRLLFVAEFLNTFAPALNLKRRQLTANDLCTLITSGRGIGEVYLKLLHAVVEDGDELCKELHSTKRQKQLERTAKQFLLRNGQNGFAVTGDATSLEDSLVILEHLCEEALLTSTINGCIEASKEKRDSLKKEYRASMKSKTKQISDDLRQLCEGGGSLEAIELRREGYLAELREMARTAESDQHNSGLPLRTSSLGQDRCGRYYWILQAIPGLVVEDAGAWFAVDSPSLLAQLMDGLCLASAREKALFDCLAFHKEAILASLSLKEKRSS